MRTASWTCQHQKIHSTQKAVLAVFLLDSGLLQAVQFREGLEIFSFTFKRFTSWIILLRRMWPVLLLLLHPLQNETDQDHASFILLLEKHFVAQLGSTKRGRWRKMAGRARGTEANGKVTLLKAVSRDYLIKHLSFTQLPCKI